MSVSRPFLNKKACENNEKQLEAFKTEIQFLMDVYQESEVNLSLDKAVVDKLNKSLNELKSLPTFYQMKSNYAVDAERLIAGLKQGREIIINEKLENVSGLTALQKRRKREVLQSISQLLYREGDAFATYRVRRKQLIIGASVAAIGVVCISVVLAVLLIFTAPPLVMIITYSLFAAFFSGCAIAGGVQIFRCRFRYMSEPMISATNESLYSLNELLNKNIFRQLEEMNTQVELEHFFESDQGITATLAFEKLKQKRDNKLVALNDDLINAKKEKESIEAAYIATLTLIQKHLSSEKVKEAELEMKATGRSTNPHVIYLENRFQQEVAKKLCAKKIEMLETAIELHQGDQVVVAKYEKYRANKKMDVKTNAAHYTEKRIGSLFTWQDSKHIQKTSSKMVDKAVNDTQAEAIAQVGECRKTWF